jgi:hypothetical protein
MTSIKQVKIDIITENLKLINLKGELIINKNSSV